MRLGIVKESYDFFKFGTVYDGKTIKMLSTQTTPFIFRTTVLITLEDST